MRRAIFGGLLAVIVVVAGVRGWLRREQDQRMADLASCLYGAALAPGEKPSDRMLRIELARPREKVSKENPQLAPARWPVTCLPLLERARDVRAADLSALAAALDAKDVSAEAVRVAADGVPSLHAPPRLASVGAMKPPWTPVVMLPQHPPMPLRCEGWLGGTDGTRAIYPGCIVEANGDERLASLRAQTPSDPKRAVPPQRPPEATALGGADLTRRFCDRAVVAWTMDSSKNARLLHVGFFENGAMMGKPIRTLVTSSFEDSSTNPDRSLDTSDAVISCRAGEAQVAFTFATSIDGVANDEVVVLTCTPGACDVRTTIVHVETGRRSNCGMCRPTEDQFQVVPPTAIGLGDAVALTWADRHTVRTRIAPLDRLGTAADHVVWYEPGDKAYFGEPAIITSWDVAILSLAADAAPSSFRFYRLDPRGPRELLAPP